MSWSRRTLLLTSATIAGSTLLPRAAAFASPARRVWLVTSRNGSGAFERGARAALESAGSQVGRLALPSRTDAGQWRQAPSLVRGGAVLGLVDVSEFVLLNELARDTTARVLCEGEHAVDIHGASRHTFLCASATLAHAIDSAEDWTEALGFDLARIAIDRWLPATVLPETSANTVPPRSSWVSFVFLA